MRGPWIYIQCKNSGWLTRHTDYPASIVFGPLVNVNWQKRRIAKAIAAWHCHAAKIFNKTLGPYGVRA